MQSIDSNTSLKEPKVSTEKPDDCVDCLGIMCMFVLVAAITVLFGHEVAWEVIEFFLQFL